MNILRAMGSALVLGRAAVGSGLAWTFSAVAEAELLRRLPHVEKEEIIKEYGEDRWLCNYFVNLWEYLKGEDTLTSYPYNVTIPIADVCNARCTFCTSWLEGTKVLAVGDVDNFAEILAHARVLGIAGHGEPLSHPNCEELFDKIGSHLDRRCTAYLITNGVLLRARRRALEKVNITTYNISLNAATPDTHDMVMGLGQDSFHTVIAAIRDLIRRRDTENPGLEVNLSLVICRDNVQELADFVAMGNELGVNRIYLRTLSAQQQLTPGLNYHRLPPYLHPRFSEYVEEAKAAIARSGSIIMTDGESWSAPVFPAVLEELITIRAPHEIDRKEALQDKSVREHYAHFYASCAEKRGLGDLLAAAADDRALDPMDDGSNPYNRSPRLHCTFVYNDFIINDFNMRLIPCCYMTHVPGFDIVRYDGSRPFFEYWNSPAFRTLRHRLREGPLYGACRKCPAQSVPPEPHPTLFGSGLFGHGSLT
jgi:wyosine [tRNA(Phe)-imidazoG37] synthetase (radical SAM superfamily)